MFPNLTSIEWRLISSLGLFQSCSSLFAISPPAPRQLSIHVSCNTMETPPSSSSSSSSAAEKIKFDHTVTTTELHKADTDYESEFSDGEAEEAPTAAAAHHSAHGAEHAADLSFDDFRRYLTFKVYSGYAKGRTGVASVAV